MKTLKRSLNSITKDLAALTTKVEKALERVESMEGEKPGKKAKPAKPAKAAATKKAAAKKVAKKSAGAEKKVTDTSKKKTVQLIKRLRKNGKSYGEITKHLVNKGIPTFSGKGKWHAQTVANILKS